MGGALLQQVNRDTQKFALKCSSAKINGRWVDVQKDPVTDSGKKSKAGRVTLWRSGNVYLNEVEKPSWHDRAVGEFVDCLVPVYRNGKLLNEIDFNEVRANAKKA